MNIPIKLLYSGAQVPVRANASDAGYDLFSVYEVSIKPGQRVVVKTGISIAVPDGYYARVAPRSGLAVKHGLDVLAGVIDSGYRAEVGVVLINLGDQEITLLPGSRVAQMIVEKCHDVEFGVTEDLPDSQRGAGGFGSSGN